MERRLVAILAADVVGYSRLVGEDEEGTLRTLRAAVRACDDDNRCHPAHGLNAVCSNRKLAGYNVAVRNSCLVYLARKNFAKDSRINSIS